MNLQEMYHNLFKLLNSDILKSTISLIYGLKCHSFLVIQVVNTVLTYDSAIPVLRHWDPVKFTSIKVINVSDDGKMDPSVGALG